MVINITIIANISLFFLVGICFGKTDFDTSSVPKIELQSGSFANKGTIPVKYTCQGPEISPPLQWEEGPENTKSYAIIVTDPDAPIPFVTITHWIVYNIPAEQTSLSENIPSGKELEDGIKQGKRSFGKFGYMGPCPPFGEHRYIFSIYALDKMLDLDPKRATRKKIMKMMKGHVVGFGEFYGVYSKK